jgi:hypothetical protein
MLSSRSFLRSSAASAAYVAFLLAGLTSRQLAKLASSATTLATEKAAPKPAAMLPRTVSAIAKRTAMTPDFHPFGARVWG